jgi:predicted negative regulator of RcsB-dependent stress response
MAEADHHRLSRHELRDPDPFQQLTSRTTAWARAHQQQLVGATAALVVIVAVATGLSWNSARNATAATARLATAQAAFASNKFADATADLDVLERDYPRTSGGRLATLYRGHALLAQAKFGEAAAAYGEYLASGPATEYLRQAALLGLATAQERSANTQAAADAYRDAAASPGPYGVLARLGLAAAERSAGHTDAANAVLNEVIGTTNLDPDTRAIAAARLGAAGSAPPAP